jgi:NAD(P)-dependent dehydrogenase (short-subunit alcohol dehydrogenase family)
MAAAGGSLAGKVAVVTGGGSGIGAACVRALAAEGARVLVADYDDEAAAAIAAEVGASGHAVAADVTDPHACVSMVAAAVDAFGRLDVAVNNAGVGPARLVRAAEIEIDDWRRVIATNLDGVFYSMRAEIPALLETGGGSIVNMSSALAVVASVGTAAYVASKHGVLGLTRAAAIEYGRNGIRVNAVGPGTTETPLTRDAIARDPERILERYPLGRVAVPEDIAPLVVFLASDASAFCTGGWYAVDGGWTAH